MRWKSKEKPVDREIRYVTRFAFLPVRTQAGITVWLEKYTQLRQYDRILGWRNVEAVPTLIEPKVRLLRDQNV